MKHRGSTLGGRCGKSYTGGEGHPSTPKGKAPTPSPKPSKVAKVAPQTPPRPLLWGPWPPLWPPT